VTSWVYDTAPGGKGKPHKEVTHTSDGDWTSQILEYDPKGRATGTKLGVPAGIPGLSGEYTVTQTYDRADRVRSVTYPAIGGLPKEAVATDYNTLGLPTRMAGLAEYVWGVNYDDRGRRTSAGFGPRPNGSTWMARNWTYNVDQQLSGTQSYVEGSSPPDGIVYGHRLTFTASGNLDEKLTRQNGLEWRECYDYDLRGRLRTAHTVASGTTCGDGTPGTGDRPYVHSYEYSADGNLKARTENGVRVPYTYPAAGEQRPHAPTRIGGDSYTWDAAGSLTSRTVGDRTQEFSWDVRGLLASVTGASGKTSFVYDASGQRLLRRTPDGKATLYVAGHEITASADGTSVIATRSYVFDGRLVATRSPSGVEYLMTDEAGSVEGAIPSGATAPTATRAYHPYGGIRDRDGKPATDRGFIGQVEDASTALSYLNARYYDAPSGVFISTDPIYNQDNIKSLNPYSYSFNNPTTFSDPSGTYSSYTFGLELENHRLRDLNRQLNAHIGRLNNHIENLQGVIRKQQSTIKDLLTYVDALEAEIARQASLIRKLQAEVIRLNGIIIAQQRKITELRGVITRQDRVIRYYRGVVDALGYRLWGDDYDGYIKSSIHSYRGIPDGAFDHDRISQLQSLVAHQSASIAALKPGPVVTAHGEAAARIAEAKLGAPSAPTPPLPRGDAATVIFWYKTAPGEELCGISHCALPPAWFGNDEYWGYLDWLKRLAQMSQAGLPRGR
jgi:RHS repeat-associated protein